MTWAEGKGVKAALRTLITADVKCAGIIRPARSGESSRELVAVVLMRDDGSSGRAGQWAQSPSGCCGRATCGSGSYPAHTSGPLGSVLKAEILVALIWGGFWAVVL